MPGAAADPLTQFLAALARAPFSVFLGPAAAARHADLVRSGLAFEDGRMSRHQANVTCVRVQPHRFAEQIAELVHGYDLAGPGTIIGGNRAIALELEGADAARAIPQLRAHLPGFRLLWLRACRGNGCIEIAEDDIITMVVKPSGLVE